MLYHVRVAFRGDEYSAYEFGMTERQLEERILRRYRAGRAFLIHGKIVEPNQIDSIRIARGPEPVESLLRRAHAEERASPVRILPGVGIAESIALGHCENVTADYITGPPGEKCASRRPRRRTPRSKKKDKEQNVEDPSPPAGLHIDETRFQVSFDGRSHVFRERSKLLFSLVRRLVRAKGQAVSFDNLRNKSDVWDGCEVEDTTISSAISRLKRKLRQAHMTRLADSIHVTTFDRRKSVMLDLDTSPAAPRRA